MVHRERGRVDAILTGIGTVMRDDPLLTCRVGTPRRNAVRVVVDPELTLPLDRQVVRTAREHRTVVTTLPKAFGEKSEHRRALGDLGVGCMKQHSDFRGLLEALRREFDVSNVLIEAGGGLPMLAVNAPGAKHHMPADAELAALGFKIVVYPQDLLAASVQAMRAALAGLKGGERAAMAAPADLARAIRMPDYLALDARLATPR
jgi:hypothetical protein